VTAPTLETARLAAARARLAASGVVVLHEDHLVLGVAKDAGVLSQRGPEGEDSLVERLDLYRREAEGKPGRAYVGLVHRLDRNVSGAMVVAKTSKAASRLSQAFRTRAVEKRYVAWVAGDPPEDEVALAGHLASAPSRRRRAREAAEDAPGARPARLSFRCDARASGSARLDVTLETGVGHQIRAQLSGAGLPIVGDRKYGGPAGPGLGRDRVALHARRLVVPHPTTGDPIAIEAPVPPDLRRLDAALRLDPRVA
jgi:23S rRNA pseudouridine1911/1915/1917 synthase